MPEFVSKQNGDEFSELDDFFISLLSKAKPFLSLSTDLSSPKTLTPMRHSLSSVLRRFLRNPNPQSRLPLSTLSSPHPNPSPRVSALVDEISLLTLLEAADLTEALRSRLGVDQLPVMAILTPGMAAGGAPGMGGAAGAVAEEKKAEKTAFDLKLESFEAASKIKIIKEVRTFTDLGLKEAKELVEKAPTVIKQGVAKEEAEKIVAKMKEIGAKIVLE